MLADTANLVFFPSEWNVSDFLAAYITLPIFLALYIGHKIYWSFYQTRYGANVADRSGTLLKQRLRIFTRLAIPVRDIDVVTGKQEMDVLESMDVPPVPRNWLEKVSQVRSFADCTAKCWFSSGFGWHSFSTI